MRARTDSSQAARIRAATARPLAAAVCGPASAHHSRAIFSDDVVSFQAEVVRFEWANPHSYIYVRSQDATGATVEWEIETQSTPGLVRRGWTLGPTCRCR